MPIELFPRGLSSQRTVWIPAVLSGDARDGFIAQVQGAVRAQSERARACPFVLRVEPGIQVDDARIVISHEPAAALATDPFAERDDGETLDFDQVRLVSWALTQALVGAGGVTHGGVCFPTIYRDALGRIKLGDFGIAPAFETACGMEERRAVLVRSEPDGDADASSGVWRLFDDDADAGWIAPYFAHELLEGAVKLNSKADQFAAGVLLYYLATGVHPYGAALSDPSLMFYVHLDPFPPADERTEWEEVFERGAADTALAADKPLLAWWGAVRQALQSDPGERHTQPRDFADALGEAVDANWATAADKLAEGLGALEAGDPEAALQAVDAGLALPLPALWRAPLAAWADDLRGRRDEIVAEQRIDQALRAARDAIDLIDIEAAREQLDAVTEVGEPTELQAATAAGLRAELDELAALLETSGTQAARAYLQTAQDHLDARRFDDVRLIATGIAQDPHVPAALKRQARELSAQADARARRLAQQRATLADSEDDLQHGRLTSAAQRLDALGAEEELPDDLRAAAEALQARVREAQAQRSEYVAALEAARTAWERCDADALEQSLASVPPDISDEELADVRRDLAQRGEALRAGRVEVAELRAAIERDNPSDSLPRLRELTSDAGADLPQRLVDECAVLLEQGEARVREREAAARSAALEALHEAEALYLRGDLDAARELLRSRVARCAHLVSEDRAQLAAVEQRLEDFSAARETLAAAHASLERDALDEAANMLADIDAEEFPPRFGEDVAAFEARLAERRAAVQAEREQAFEAGLAKIAELVERGELDEALDVFARLGRSPSAAYAERRAEAGAELARLQPFHERLTRAEAALADPAGANVSAVRRHLKAIDADAPQFARERRAALLARADAVEIEQRAQAERDAGARLDDAERALAAGDVAASDAALGDAERAIARCGPDATEALQTRKRALRERLAEVAPWVERNERLAAALAAEDVVAAQQAARDLRDQDVPKELREEADTLLQREVALRAAHAVAIDETLDALATELEQRGKRARDLPDRIGEVLQRPLISNEQRGRAEALAAQFDALPEPKSHLPLMAAIGAGAVVVVVVVSAAWSWFGGGGEPQDANDARAQQRDDADEPRLVAQPGSEDAEVAGLEPQGGEEDVVAATPANNDSSNTAGDGDPVARDDAQTPPANEQPVRVEPDPVFVALEAARERIQAELDGYAGELSPTLRDSGAVRARFEPADALPTELVVAGAREGARVAVVTEAALAEVAPPRAWVWEAVGVPPMREVAARFAETLSAKAPRLRFEVVVEEGAAHTAQLMPTYDGIAGAPAVAVERAPAGDRVAESAAAVLAELEPFVDVARRVDAAFVLASLPEHPHLPTDAARWPLTLARDGEPPRLVLEDEVARVSGRFRVSGWRGSESISLTLELGANGIGVVEGEHEILQLASARANAERVQLAAAVREVLPTPWETDTRVADAKADALLAVKRGGEQFALVDVAWDAVAGVYEFDREALRDAVRTGLLDQFASPATGDQLDDDIAALRRAVAPAEGAPGASVVGRLEVSAVGDARVSRLERAEVAARLTLQDPQRPTVRMDVPVVVAWERGGWRFADTQPDSAVAAVANALRDAAQSPAVRSAAQSEALEALRAALADGAEPSVTRAPDGALEAVVTDDEGETRYRWRWSEAALAWVDRSAERVARASESRDDDPVVAERPTGVDAPDDTPATRAAIDDATDQATERATPEDAITADTADGAPRDFVLLPLSEQLRTLAAARDVTPEPFWTVVRGVSAAKAARMGAPAYRVEEVGGLRAVGQRLRRAVAPNPARDPYPTVFIELFRNDDGLYAISWRADADAGAITERAVALVQTASELAVYRSSEAWRAATRGALGEPLLGAALGERIRASADGSFGVCIAPDDVAWLTRWEQVGFGRRSVAGITGGAPDAVESLRPLLAEAPGAENAAAPRRVGVWCVPTLAGVWTGGEDYPALSLGRIDAIEDDLSARFRRRGGLVIAPISDPTLRGADFTWPRFVSGLGPGNVGSALWNRRYRNGQWQPTPFVSFACLPVAP